MQTIDGVRTTTYYCIDRGEPRYAGLPDEVPLFDAAREGTIGALAMVPRRFAADLAMEGSGRLADRSVVNYVGGPADGSGPLRVHVEPPSKPWGTTASGRPAVPLRTLAVDRGLVPLGARCYLAALDGWRVPLVGGVGGFTHDGWFAADDVGGAIVGAHVDVFTGPRAMRDPLRARMPSGPSYSLVVDASTAGRGGPWRPPPAPPPADGGGGVSADALVLTATAGLAAWHWRADLGRWLGRLLRRDS